MAICPMCGLGDKFIKSDTDNEEKSQCAGCGTKFYNKERTIGV